MRRLRVGLGAALLSAPLVTMTVLIVHDAGWKVAVAAWAALLAVGACSSGGMWLVLGGREE